nr:unnamed protein product [Spirometra erinaceieuropaei]
MRPSPSLQGHSEGSPEVSGDQPANWEDLAHDRPTWRRTVKTGTVIYEANCIVVAKAKRQTRKSQLRPSRGANAQPPATCPSCQRTFEAPSSFVGHLCINHISRTTSLALSLSYSAPSFTPTTNIDRTPESPLPSSSSYSFTASASATAAPVPTTVHTFLTHQQTSAPTKDLIDVDSIHACPHCDRTFTSHIGLIDYLLIHRTETVEPVLGPRPHSVALCGQHHHQHTQLILHIYRAYHRTTPLASVFTISSSTVATISETNTDIADFSCPQFPRTFTPLIGLVGRLRIHRTETDKPVPGAPTYTRLIRLNCPQCTRTSTHGMGLLGRMRIHENLR